MPLGHMPCALGMAKPRHAPWASCMRLGHGKRQPCALGIACAPHAFEIFYTSHT